MALLWGYCEGNGSVAQAWVQGGFQPCFFFTLVPAVLLSVCLLLGALQYACYLRFGRAMEPKYIPRSPLYRAQVLLSLLLALQPFGGLLWQVAGGRRLYGYMVLHACLWALSWGCAVALLQLERRRVLAHDRTRGHGTVLLLFWALAFAAENLALVCWRSPLWWWALGDTNQKVRGQGRGSVGARPPPPWAKPLPSRARLEPFSPQVQFGFWLLRYGCTFLLFVLGMKAPGLPHKPYMLLVNEEERDVENSQVSPGTLGDRGWFSCLVTPLSLRSPSHCCRTRAGAAPPGRIFGGSCGCWRSTCGQKATACCRGWCSSAWLSWGWSGPSTSSSPSTTRTSVRCPGMVVLAQGRPVPAVRRLEGVPNSAITEQIWHTPRDAAFWGGRPLLHRVLGGDTSDPGGRRDVAGAGCWGCFPGGTQRCSLPRHVPNCPQ